MAGIISTGSFPKLLLETTAVKIWGDSFGKYKPEYPEIYTDYNTTNAFEEDVEVTGLGMFNVLGEGEGVTYDSMAQGNIKRYTWVEYVNGYIITKNMYMDNKWDRALFSRTNELAYGANQTMEVVAIHVLDRSFNSNYVGADGKELCATDHPNKSGGTWRNELTTPAQLSEASLEQCCLDIGKFNTDRGLKYKALPVALIIHPDEEFNATRILKSIGQPDILSNNTNAIRTLGKIPKVIVNHYLSDSTPHYFWIKTDAPEGFKHWIREAVTFGNDNDFDTKNAKFMASFRQAWSWTNSRCAFGSAAT